MKKKKGGVRYAFWDLAPWFKEGPDKQMVQVHNFFSDRNESLET